MMIKRIFQLLGILTLLGLGLFIYGGWQLFGDELRAIKSLKMVQERVYTFEYKGDYGFRGFLDQGGAKTDAEMAAYIANFLSKGYMQTAAQNPDGGCSTIASEGLFCRNFDWNTKSHYVVIKTDPDDGYASISTSGFAFLGLGEEWHPIAGMDGMTALATIYIPMDGMNEMGLCVSDLVEIDGSTETPDTEKPDLTIVAAIRLVLDYAKDSQEAVSLLSKYDIFPSVNTAHHLAISDRDDNNIVVEWHKGEMIVTPTPIVTNHSLSTPTEHPLICESQQRFADLLENHSSLPSHESGVAALKSAAYEDQTRWSVIYDKNKLSATHYFDCNWENPLTFTLGE